MATIVSTTERLAELRAYRERTGADDAGMMAYVLGLIGVVAEVNGYTEVKAIKDALDELIGW